MRDIADWLAGAGTVERSVHANGSKRAVRLERAYETTAADLWSAWTDRDRLRRWLGEVTGDLREGGEFTLDMGAGEIASCTIVLCDPPHRLVAEWREEARHHGAVDLRLEPSESGASTLVRLEHVGVLGEEQSRDYGEGWEDFLHRLGQYVRGSEPTSLPWKEVRAALDPYWEPHTADPTPDPRWPDCSNDVIRVSRDLDAPLSEVWSAVTTPDALDRWFAKVTLTGTAWTAEFSQGSGSGVVSSCSDREFVTTWGWDDGAPRRESVVTVSLEPLADGRTRLSLAHAGVDPGGSLRGHAAGWYAHLSGLTAYVEHGRRPTESEWNAEFSLARHGL